MFYAESLSGFVGEATGDRVTPFPVDVEVMPTVVASIVQADRFHAEIYQRIVAHGLLVVE